MNGLVKVAGAVVLASAALGSPAVAKGPPELSAPEMAQVQARRYAVPPKAAFNAVLSSLQTLGFVDIDADRESGTVSAITDAKAKTIFNIFWGFGKKKWTQKASLLVEEDGAGSRVRLNMMLSETKARGIFGTSFTDGKLVRVAAPYQEFFQVLDADMAQRGATASVAAPAVGAGIGAGMGAGGVVNLGGGVALVPAKTASGYCIRAAANYAGTGSSSKPSVTSARPLC